MLQTYLQGLVEYLHLHPHQTGLIIYVIAFTESLAIVGSIIPGSVSMTAVGALIGAGIIPASTTFTWAILGALTGDYLSYWIGAHYNYQLRSMWPFSKYPDWIRKGEDFFYRHGGKSIIIGRFIGPMRSMVPMIAGMLNMTRAQFILATIPSAMLWTIVYMVPGILLGALSLELPHGLAIKFVLVILLLIASIWLLVWLIKLSFKQITKFVDQYIARLWTYSQSHPRTQWITNLLSDPHYPNNHQQLALTILTAFSILIFLTLALNTFINGGATAFNLPIFYFLKSLYAISAIKFSTVITMLGYNLVLLPTSFIVLLWFLWKRYLREAWHWTFVIISSAAITGILKHFIYSPRPNVIDQSIANSFPSGHTILTLAFFGFLAVLIARQLKNVYQRIPYIVATCITGLVLISRLYLGDHWLTDIIASVFLGLSLVLIATISYRREPARNIQYKQLIIISLISWLIIAGFSIHKNYSTLLKTYKQTWANTTISMTTWWHGQTITKIPVFRNNRFGHPVQALNIQWAGYLNRIEEKLQKQGWEDHSEKPTLKTTLQHFSKQSKAHRLPLLPALYQNQPPTLTMTKMGKDDKNVLILRLWDAHIVLLDSNLPLWIGNIEQHQPSYKQLFWQPHQFRPPYLSVIQKIIPYLKSYRWREVTYPEYANQPITNKLQWDRKILLIRPSSY